MFQPIDIKSVCFIYARFLERKICNSLVNVADRLKKLRDSGQPYLVNVKIVVMYCSLFVANIYSRGLTFLQVIYETFGCDLTHGFFFMIAINIFL